MATRPWIITPTAWLNRIWAPTLDYSSTWGNWNFNLGPNDWDFLSICLLLTPYQDWSAFPTPIVYDLRNSAKVYSTQLMEPCHWSPLWWGQPPQPTRLHAAHHLSPPMIPLWWGWPPDQPGCTPHTIYPLLPHGIPYWTVRICVTHSNKTPQSLPLISLTSPEPTRH